MPWWGDGGWWWAGALFVVFCMGMMGLMMGRSHSGHGWRDGPEHGHSGHGWRDGSERTLANRSGPDAEEILAERFARGEISQDEFEQRKRVLERTPS